MDKSLIYEKMPYNVSFPLITWNSDNASFPPHLHDFFEMLYVIKGGLYVSMDDAVYEAGSGDIIMINPGVIHGFFDTKQNTTILGLQFSITFFDESFIELREIIFQNPVIDKSKMLVSPYTYVCRLMQDISREYHEKAIGYQLAIISKLNELMLVILREMPKIERKIPSTKSRHIHYFILKNYDDPDLVLEKAASALNLNKFYFSHIFKKYMGHTFHSYLTIVRVNYAKRFLIETKMSIIDVAFRTGFNSLQTFNRVFKSLTGFTPGNYRRENCAPNSGIGNNLSPYPGKTPVTIGEKNGRFYP